MPVVPAHQIEEISIPHVQKPHVQSLELSVTGTGGNVGTIMTPLTCYSHTPNKKAMEVRVKEGTLELPVNLL